MTPNSSLPNLLVQKIIFSQSHEYQEDKVPHLRKLSGCLYRDCITGNLEGASAGDTWTLLSSTADTCLHVVALPKEALQQGIQLCPIYIARSQVGSDHFVLPRSSTRHYRRGVKFDTGNVRLDTWNFHFLERFQVLYARNDGVPSGSAASVQRHFSHERCLGGAGSRCMMTADGCMGLWL